MTTQHTNRLVHETSPYLLQHAHNPVDWYPWGREALERARREDKLILLSIGYSACHWCHVMERESFENETIAELMNRDFVNVKVDREERPDLDDVYMAATLVMNQGQGGWPMTVFLTPELEPIFAGTYFPPDDRWGRPGFASLLDRITQAWKDDRDNLVENAGKLAERLRQEKEGPRAAARRGRGGARPGTQALCRRLRRRARRLRPGSQVPALRRPAVARAPAPSIRRRPSARNGREDPRRHGPGRDLRPGRRRLRALLDRRRVARAALRENALRQRPAGARPTSTATS